MIGNRLDATIVFHLHKYANTFPVTDMDRAKVFKLHELKPGMALAAGIYSLSGAKLLPVDTVLDEDTICQIASYAKAEPIEETVFIK